MVTILTLKTLFDVLIYKICIKIRKKRLSNKLTSLDIIIKLTIALFYSK